VSVAWRPRSARARLMLIALGMRLQVTPGKMPSVRARRWRNLAILLGVLIAGIFLGCATSPAEREATERAWTARDAERARECAQRGGRWIAGGCAFKGI
jgi:hypothetical protein